MSLATLNKAGETCLRKKLGGRASFNKIERKLYGHDIAVIPPLVRPVVGNTTPDAVVLVAMVSLMTPRGFLCGLRPDALPGASLTPGGRIPTF